MGAAQPLAPAAQPLAPTAPPLPRRRLLATALPFLLAQSPPQLTALRIHRGRGTPASILIPGAHSPVPGRPAPAPSILDGRARLVVETVDDGTDLAPLRAAPAGAAALAAADLDRLRACLDPRIALESLRPFALFEALAAAPRGPLCPGLPPPGAEPAPAIGGDAWLLDLARARRLPIAGAETLAERSQAIARIPDAIFLALIRRLLAGEPAAPPHAARIAAALDAGAHDDLREAVLDTFALPPAERLTLAQHLLDDRNRVMAARLAPMLGRESLLVALGAAHLGGTQGVARLLADRGFTLDRLRIAAVMAPR